MSAPGVNPEPSRPGPSVPRLPFLLLGLLTLVTFAGPFVIFVTIRGGPRPDWPPDRPVEWWAFGAITAMVLALMAASLTVGLWARPGRR